MRCAPSLVGRDVGVHPLSPACRVTGHAAYSLCTTEPTVPANTSPACNSIPRRVGGIRWAAIPAARARRFPAQLLLRAHHEHTRDIVPSYIRCLLLVSMAAIVILLLLNS